MDRHDDRDSVHEVWKRSKWNNWFTTNQGALQVWAKSHHASTTLLKDLNELRDKNDPVSIIHKEEGIKRISNDEEDRLKLRKAIETCVHPLLELESPMCNIYIQVKLQLQM